MTCRAKSSRLRYSNCIKHRQQDWTHIKYIQTYASPLIGKSPMGYFIWKPVILISRDVVVFSRLVTRTFGAIVPRILISTGAPAQFEGGYRTCSGSEGIPDNFKAVATLLTAMSLHYCTSSVNRTRYDGLPGGTVICHLVPPKLTRHMGVLAITLKELTGLYKSLSLAYSRRYCC